MRKGLLHRPIERRHVASIRKSYEPEDFNRQNTMAAAQFNEDIKDEGVAMHSAPVAEHEQYANAEAAHLEASYRPPVELHVVQFDALAMMVTELGAQLKGIQTIVDDLYKSRVFHDEWVAVSSAVEYTLD